MNIAYVAPKTKAAGATSLKFVVYYFGLMTLLSLVRLFTNGSRHHG